LELADPSAQSRLNEPRRTSSFEMAVALVENQAGANQASAASQELSKLAASLSTLVARFLV